MLSIVVFQYFTMESLRSCYQSLTHTLSLLSGNSWQGLDSFFFFFLTVLELPSDISGVLLTGACHLFLAVSFSHWSYFLSGFRDGAYQDLFSKGEIAGVPLPFPLAHRKGCTCRVRVRDKAPTSWGRQWAPNVGFNGLRQREAGQHSS